MNPRSHPRPRARLVSLVALALLASSPAAVAAAATPSSTTATTAADQMRYAGANINNARVPAAPVEIEVWSRTPATSVRYLLDGKQVAVDPELRQDGDHWVATATVDLTGRTGSTQLKVWIEAGTQVRSFWKYFTAVKPVAEVVPVLDDGSPRAGADTTGVPAGTVLTPSGSLRITTPGTVVDGLDVTGCITVLADDVTIRNTRITCTSPSNVRAISGSKARRLLVEDSEIDGTGTTKIGIEATSATIRRNEVRRVEDGIRIGSNIVIQDNWVHDMVREGTGHPDAIQGISAQNVTITGNTLDPINKTTGDVGNSAIMLGSETGYRLSKDVVIRDNVLGGGNYAINISGSINASGIAISENRFLTDSRFGPVVTPVRVPVGAGNVYDESGLPIRVDAPK